MNTEPTPIAGETRDLKCTLEYAEFGAVQWASKRAGKWPRKAVPLAQFFHDAVMVAVRATVRDEIARGKSIPPNIAAVLDEKRGNPQSG